MFKIQTIKHTFFLIAFTIFSACGGTGSDEVAKEVTSTDSICPGGYVIVPAHDELGVPDFCVMQYEAKNNGSGKPVSKREVEPWRRISLTDAWNACRSLNTEKNDNDINNDADENGTYALISNPEWMSIARNIENIDKNWTGGTKGSGCLFRGNVGSVPSCNGVNPGYHSRLKPDFGTNRSRTVRLTLSNEKEVWDLSGNIAEWVDWDKTNTLTLIPKNKKAFVGGDGGPRSTSKEFKDLTENIGEDDEMFPDSWQPTDPNLTGADHGIGLYYAGSSGVGTAAAIRGGNYIGRLPHPAGVFALDLSAVGFSSFATGFRCVYRP